MEKENRVEEIMRLLKCTEEEAKSVIEADKAIDKGEKLFELTDEQKANVKKVTKAGTRETKKPFTLDLKPRERKKNATKGAIIAVLAKFLTENEEILVENLQILNEEKLISFSIGENTYELDLKQKRKPKK